LSPTTLQTLFGSQHVERNEKGCSEEGEAETSVILFRLLGIFTLECPVISSGATNETHYGVNKHECGEFLLDHFQDKESKWNSEANSEGGCEILVKILLNWLTLHGFTLGVDVDTDGRDDHVKETQKQDRTNCTPLNFKLEGTTGKFLSTTVNRSGLLICGLGYIGCSIN